MKKFLPVLFVICISCNSQKKSQIALKFINDYTTYCNESIGKNDIDTSWIRNNKLLTESFKKSYYAMLEQGWKDEPYVGLDFDPILDAQDFADKTGYEIISSDSNGFVTLKSSSWTNYTVTMKVVHQNKRWLVDGCGVINIPKEKRAER